VSAEPGALELRRRGVLGERIAALAERLDPCTLCPHRCGAHRRSGEVGQCGLGAEVRLARACHHRGEEPPLSGTRGAGTLFFAGCNLRCGYCQNHQISRDPGAGAPVTSQALAREMLGLQAAGCHNVELVTATPVLPLVLEALDIALGAGLCLPLVHNTSAYERVEVLRLLDGVVDVYLPDLKYGTAEAAVACGAPADYVERSQAAVLEMARQVGPLALDAAGLARRGLLVRHLVLPADRAATSSVLGFVALELGPRTAVSLMAQYRPPPGLPLQPPLDRPLHAAEYDAAVAALEQWGLTAGWTQTPDAAETYVPDFDAPRHPFEG